MNKNIILEMAEYFGNDVRRINHALKVYGFAMAIAGGEGLEGEYITIIGAASILHDIGIPMAEKKYGSCIGKYQEKEGPPVAREILERLHYDTEITDRVCHLVGNHHSYSKINGIDFQILVEADFLVNIFEDQLTHALQSIGEKYFKTTTGKRLLESMYSL